MRIIHRQEIPAVIKIPPTFIRALVVYKVISILKEGFEDFFPCSAFLEFLGSYREFQALKYFTYMNCLSVSEVFLHLRAPSRRRGWRGTGWPAHRAGRGELAPPPPCWDTGVAAGPWLLARRSAQSRRAKLCLGPGCLSRSSGVTFVRESCHAGRAASPSARCGALASPAASRGPGHHLLRLAAALQVAARVTCTKVRLCAGLPGLFSGSPRPVSTVPPAWQQCQRCGEGCRAAWLGRQPGCAFVPSRRKASGWRYTWLCRQRVLAVGGRVLVLARALR